MAYFGVVYFLVFLDYTTVIKESIHAMNAKVSGQ